MKNDTSFILKVITTFIATCFILYWIIAVIFLIYGRLDDVGADALLYIYFLVFIVIVFLEILATIGIWRNPLRGGVGFVLLGLLWLGIWFLMGFGVPMIWVISSLLVNLICGGLSLWDSQFEIEIKEIIIFAGTSLLVISLVLLILWIRNYQLN